VTERGAHVGRSANDAARTAARTRYLGMLRVYRKEGRRVGGPLLVDAVGR
jgi:hypothetical protein